MSQYQLVYHEKATYGLIGQAAGLVWTHPKYGYARDNFPDLMTFVDAMLDDLRDFPALAAYSGNRLVAAMSFTTLTRDLHMPGVGSIVASTIADPDFPGAAGVLLKAYVDVLRNDGADWYQISKRLDANTVLTKYRRLHG